MDKKTRDVLEYSIEHWEENVASKRPSQVSLGPQNCALCRQFLSKDCVGCPVKESTGSVLCDGSPYDDACVAYHHWKRGYRTRRYFTFRAKKMLDFLKALRDRDEEY